MSRTIDLVAKRAEQRQSAKEQARMADLMRVLPRGLRTVLDIGTRDGYYARMMTEHFEAVTAIDLEQPTFSFDRVETAVGDVTRLNFPDNSFDCVFCAEVLEHIPALEAACAEIQRVTRHAAVIGVPYRQDLRVARTTCQSCGKTNPPYGHVNSFDERKLAGLFPQMRIASKSFVGSTKTRTNALSAFLMDLAGNPWGAYSQEEPCMHCEAMLVRPESRGLASRVCSKAAALLNQAQAQFTQPRGNWIHLVLEKCITTT